MIVSLLTLLLLPWQIPTVLNNEEPLNGWNQNRSRNPFPYILPMRQTTLLTGRNICQKMRPPVLLMVVCTAVNHFELRTAIRNTWAKDAYRKYRISVAFLIGVENENIVNKKVVKENLKHQDIIVDNFIDSYNNLTVKSIRLIKWARSNCAHAKFLMKSDDDVYINLKNLAAYLSGLAVGPFNSKFLVGFKMEGSPVIREPIYANYVPRYMYANDQYPPYLSGVSYLMTMPTALRLYLIALNKQLFVVEDVHITGTCALEAGIKVRNEEKFAFKQTYSPFVCTGKDMSMIVYSHKVNPQQIDTIHTDVGNCYRKQPSASSLVRSINHAKSVRHGRRDRKIKTG